MKAHSGKAGFTELDYARVLDPTSQGGTALVTIIKGMAFTGLAIVGAMVGGTVWYHYRGSKAHPQVQVYMHLLSCLHAQHTRQGLKLGQARFSSEDSTHNIACRHCCLSFAQTVRQSPSLALLCRCLQQKLCELDCWARDGASR